MKITFLPSFIMLSLDYRDVHSIVVIPNNVNCDQDFTPSLSSHFPYFFSSLSFRIRVSSEKNWQLRIRHVSLSKAWNVTLMAEFKGCFPRM